MKKLLIIFSILFLISPSFSQTTVMTPFLYVFGTLTADSIWARAYGNVTGGSGTADSTFLKIVAEDSLRIGKSTTTDNVVPYLRLQGDADLDLSGITKSICTLTLAGNANPTLAYWNLLSTSNRFKFGGATDYVSLEPDNTAGILNIVAASSGDWKGIVFSGAGFNNANDNLIYYSTNIYWNRNNGIYTTGNLGTPSGYFYSYYPGSLRLGQISLDNGLSFISLRSDFDSDAVEATSYVLELRTNTNTNPALGYWSWTSTGGLGYSFDKTIFANGLQLTNGLKSKYVDSTGVDGIVTNKSIDTTWFSFDMNFDNPLGITQDTLFAFKNMTHDDIVITEIEIVSDFNHARLIVNEVNEHGGGYSRIDSLYAATVSAGKYYDNNSGLTHTVEPDHRIIIPRPIDDCDMLAVTISGYSRRLD